MDLYKAKFMKHMGFYFSTDENCFKFPCVWIRFYKDRYYMCGNTFYLDMYLPEKFRINGFKNEKTAFSYLHSMTLQYESFDLKQRKKMGFLNMYNQEYSCDTIRKYNETYRKFISYTKQHGKPSPK